VSVLTTLEELRQFMATATCNECREEAWALVITLLAPGVIPVKINFATECEHGKAGLPNMIWRSSSCSPVTLWPPVQLCKHPVKTFDRTIKPCKLRAGHNGGHNPF